MHFEGNHSELVGLRHIRHGEGEVVTPFEKGSLLGIYFSQLDHQKTRSGIPLTHKKIADFAQFLPLSGRLTMPQDVLVDFY